MSAFSPQDRREVLVNRIVEYLAIEPRCRDSRNLTESADLEFRRECRAQDHFGICPSRILHQTCACSQMDLNQAWLPVKGRSKTPNGRRSHPSRQHRSLNPHFIKADLQP